MPEPVHMITGGAAPTMHRDRVTEARHGSPMSVPADASLAHILGRLRVLEHRVRARVGNQRTAEGREAHVVEDQFRGLFISKADVERLLSRHEQLTPEEPAVRIEMAEVDRAADEAEGKGNDIRLRRLARAFELDALDIELLLIALAPDLDPRFERFYGYLHDDMTRRRASIGLALELAGVSKGSADGRRRFRPGSPLLHFGLLLVEEQERPFLTRSLRIADRVAMHLVGDNRVDQDVANLLVACHPESAGDPSGLAEALSAAVKLCYLRESIGSTGRALAAAAFGQLHMPTLAVDLQRLGTEDNPITIAASAAREGRLLGAGLVAGPVERLVERGIGAVRAFSEGPGAIILTGSRVWDPTWSRRVPLVVEVAKPDFSQRAGMWRASLDGRLTSGLDPADATGQFRLGPEQVARAATAAGLQAALNRRPIDLHDLRAAARAQNAAGLERLARRIEPRVGWDDLVLPAAVLGHLRELAARARQRDKVLDLWGMGRKSSRGRGITALFAGESGTGKTMSAEVVAAELGLNLYVIDLSSVVDKYIGETEKNLDRIFAEAEGVNGVLLFDEADALFGKRSEVKDARDRYANVEVAYLLQRMELFEGIAILTTNIRANVDEAFTRRLDIVVDFAVPEEADRRRLWRQFLGSEVPQYEDIELDFLASAFDLTGGNIRNATLTAAYLAADAGRPVAMADLIRGTEREYRKLGRLCVVAEFGRYFELVQS